jgi:PD-(D/E)XK endonuclease
MSYASIDISAHPKQQGEWAELLFMARAAEHGLSILRPWGDSSPYDLALICPDQTQPRPSILRVQIKSTSCRHSAGAYKCHIDSNGVPYRPGLLDFIAAYVIPDEAWFIIPLDATHGQKEILLAPHRPRSKYAKYKEAWHLLQPE